MENDFKNIIVLPKPMMIRITDWSKNNSGLAGAVKITGDDRAVLFAVENTNHVSSFMEIYAKKENLTVLTTRS